MHPFFSSVVLIIFGAAFAATADRVSAQGAAPLRRVIIADEVTCPNCQLMIEPVQVLGLVPDSELLDRTAGRMFRDRTGRIWAGNDQINGTLQVFSPDGRAELFGRPGAGPGEFNNVAALGCSASGDVLLLSSDRRFHTIDADTRSVKSSPRSAAGPMARTMIAVSDTTVWLSAPPRDPAYLGYPLVEYDTRSGRVIAAWGKTVERFDRMVERHAGRVLDRFPGGRVIAAHLFEYVLDVYALNGTLLTQYVRDAPWYRPQLKEWTDGYVVAAHPLNERFVLTSILMEVRPPKWKYPSVGKEGQPDNRETAERYDSVVEVLDLVQERVVYRRRLADPLVGTICPTGEFVVAGVENGLEKLTVVRLHFKEVRQ